jgi:DNA-binding NarL/FixJ family response regulator
MRPSRLWRSIARRSFFWTYACRTSPATRSAAAFASEFGDGIAIVFLSGDRTADYDRTAGLLLGADDYVVKPFAGGELIARVRRAIDRAPAAAAAAAYRLTKRELEVLRLLSDGLGEKKIAEALVITRKTVATHLQRVLLKLDVHSRAEAVAFAHRNRLFVHR